MNGINSLALIAVAGVIFFLFGKPIWDETLILNETKSKYQESVEDMNSVEQKKNELLAKLDAIPVEDREKIETFLPESPQIVDLVAEIDSLAGKHGISITNISTNQVVQSSNTVQDSPVARDYASTNLSFAFKSSYEKLVTFLSEMETSLRVMDIRNISVNVGDGGVYDYKITAEVYWLKQNEIK